MRSIDQWGSNAIGSHIQIEADREATQINELVTCQVESDLASTCLRIIDITAHWEVGDRSPLRDIAGAAIGRKLVRQRIQQVILLTCKDALHVFL